MANAANPRILALGAALALAGPAATQMPAEAPEALFHKAFYLEVGAGEGVAAARLYARFLLRVDSGHPLAVEAAARLEDLVDLLAEGRAGRPEGPIRGWGNVVREDWAHPTSIPWQRTMEDALELSGRTGKPLLICVNMDEEPASETFAAKKYRDPAFAELASRFVPVIASPNRHNPRDYDAQGRRIPCPRFGCVTCGEHMAMEQAAFERFFGDQRVAPRHIGVAADGRRLFDHFLEGDLSLVDASLQRHGKAALNPLLASRDARDRAALEESYLLADPGTRAALLEAAVRSSAKPFDLLRLGLQEQDARLRALAARALGATATEDAAPLVFLELRRAAPGGESEEALAGALVRLAEKNRQAADLLAARRAAAAPSEILSAEPWLARLRGAAAPPPAEELDLFGLDEALEAAYAAAAKGDPEGRIGLRLAELNLKFAELRIQAGKDPSAALEDAARAALQAEKHAPVRGRALGVRARALWLQGDRGGAGALAEEALPLLIPEGESPLAAELLAIHARVHAGRVYDAGREGRPWPARSMTEALRAFELLGRHPLGGEPLLLEHLDFLVFLGLHHETGAVLADALRRNPVSPGAHERYRAHLWREGDPARIEAGYQGSGPWGERAAREHGAQLEWYAAFASLVAAEEFARQERKAEAAAAYGRARTRFAASAAAEPGFHDTASHFSCLALAGQAWLALEAGEPAAALELFLQALAARPASFRDRDGLGRSPEELGRRLRTEFSGQGMEAGLERLDQALKAVGVE